MVKNNTLRPVPGLLLRAVLAVTAAAGAVTLAPAGTPGTPSADAATAKVRTHKVHRAFRVARRQLGDPYRYGAAGPNAFDCSGLTYFSFRRAGFRHVPRTSAQQAHAVRHIRRSHMRRGDLVFFRRGGKVQHVGVFTGWHHHHRVIIHAPSPGHHVRRDRIWTNNWFAGTLR